MRLTDSSVTDLLAAFASADPTPGGGSASALASAVGASLLMMVAALPKTRTGADEEKAALAASTEILTGIRQQLTEAIDADSAAYNQVVAAYRRPKATPAEQDARKAAIQRALRAAIDVPLGVMRLSFAALDEAKTIAARSNPSAASDVGVATLLLEAGLGGAKLNVEANLSSVRDEVYAKAVRAEMARCARSG